MPDKIALAMIVKGVGEEPKKLDRLLKTIAPYINGIFVTLTGPKEELTEAENICKKYNVHVSYFQTFIEVTPQMRSWIRLEYNYSPHIQVGDKIFNFGEARNFNFSLVPQEYKWIMWLDCDDIFRGGEHLGKMLRLADEQKAAALYMEYLYQVEADQEDKITKVIIHHSRERVVKNGFYEWKGIIHEVLIEKSLNYKVLTPDCDVVHLTSEQDRINSLQRNIKNLEVAIYKTQGEEIRYIYYLAKAFFDIRQPQYNILSRNLMFKYLLGKKQSDWEEERAQAWDYIAELYRRDGEYNNAISSLMNGLVDYPESPLLFIGLGTTYAMKGQWERALFWLNLGEAVQEKITFLAKHPQDSSMRIAEIKYNCYSHLGKLKEAKAAIAGVCKMFPDNLFYKQLMDDIDKKLAH